MCVASRVRQWTKIRDAVLNEATRPLDEPATILGEVFPDQFSPNHQRNRELFIERLQEVCVPYDPQISAKDFWRYCWQDRHRAGVTAAGGNTIIDTIINSHAFDDYADLAQPAWDVDINFKARQPINYNNWGAQAVAFLRDVNGNKWKLINIVRTARAIHRFVTDNPNRPILELLGAGNLYENRLDFWAAHERFSYQGAAAIRTAPDNHLENLMPIVPAFHILMDIGLQCVKPDIVLTDEMHRLGWLPPGTLADGTGRDRIPQHYNKEYLYRPMIDSAVEISEAIPDEDLVFFEGTDITHNPVRAFDFILVKYGQEPEPACGIVRNLDKIWCPIEEFVHGRPNYTPLRR